MIDALIRAFLKFLSWFGPVGAIALVVWNLIGGLDGILAALQALIEMSDAAMAFIHSPGVAGFYGKANRIFPVAESFGMASSLLGMKLLALTVRVGKSWIPGLS